MDSEMKWWSDFLAARAAAIDTLRDEGKSYDEIRATLNIDREQVESIANRPERTVTHRRDRLAAVDPSLTKRVQIIIGGLELAAKPITMRPDGDREIRMLVDVYALRGRHEHLATFDLSVPEWEALVDSQARAA